MWQDYRTARVCDAAVDTVIIVELASVCEREGDESIFSFMSYCFDGDVFPFSIYIFHIAVDTIVSWKDESDLYCRTTFESIYSIGE